MSTAAANAPVIVQYNCTWEETFTFLDADGAGIDLTGYKARLQARAEATRYGITGSVLFEKDSDADPTEILFEESADHLDDNGDPILCVVRLKVPFADVNLVNPSNLRKVKGPGYGIQLYKDSEVPEYVVPLVEGVITCLGSTVR